MAACEWRSVLPSRAATCMLPCSAAQHAAGPALASMVLDRLTSFYSAVQHMCQECTPCHLRPRSIDDTDRRAKALWLPVQNSNCPTTCTGVGLVPVTLVAGDLNRAACAAFPPKSDDDDFYAGALSPQQVLPEDTRLVSADESTCRCMSCPCAQPCAAGTWRKLAAGNRCQAADDDDDARIRSFTSNYYCACVPRKASSPGGLSCCRHNNVIAADRCTVLGGQAKCMLLSQTHILCAAGSTDC